MGRVGEVMAVTQKSWVHYWRGFPGSLPAFRPATFCADPRARRVLPAAARRRFRPWWFFSVCTVAIALCRFGGNTTERLRRAEIPRLGRSAKAC